MYMPVHYRSHMNTLHVVYLYPGHHYLVHTFTGDKRGAGTDANVVITIFGEDGDSGEKKLDNARNNFERGKYVHVSLGSHSTIVCLTIMC